jgi:isopentenyl diphosphate isomerase/L-lactate dehydrogenase-like FMN-dependent dehydrogenase
VGTDLDRLVSLADFEPLARLAMEPAAFDYVAGGAWDEITLAENEAAWRRYRLRPRVLVDVSRVDPSTALLGGPAAIPAAVAPMAVQAIAHPEAEVAAIRGAAAAGVPFTLSTMSSCSLEEVAAAAPDAVRWFQLYAQAEPSRTRELVDRAAAAGYRAIVLTVDLPVLGYRERDLRSGFVVPALGNFRDVPPTHIGRVTGTDRDPLEDLVTTGLTWDHIGEIRGWSPLPLVLKGILTAEDARLAVDHGVEGIVVSNHGARQLDRVPAAVDTLAEVVAAADGRAEVWVDGGVRRGLDIAIALALGARGVLVGKPVYWALAAGGAEGVERALVILREEFELALALLGAPTAADLTPDHVLAPDPGR